MHETTYPDTFYCVSVKALIKNNKGELLVLKEDQDTRSLPGGGFEQPQDAKNMEAIGAP